MENPEQGIGIDQRRAVLQREIARYVGDGFHVVSQTDTTAQLVKPKSFSCLLAVLGLLLFVLGLVIYLIYFASRKDKTVYLEVDANGKVTRR